MTPWPYLTPRPDPARTAARMAPALLLDGVGWRLDFHRGGRGCPALRALWRAEVRALLVRALAEGLDVRATGETVGGCA